MTRSSRHLRTAFATLCLAASCGFAGATAVSSGGSGSTGTLTDLGLFAAGTYTLTGSGYVDLVGDNSFLINADGSLHAPVTTPGYDYFNPNGSYTADGNFGAAGANAKIGALIGSFSASPATASDWFLIGNSDTITLGSAGHIYASVNDTFHDNDVGSFTVSATVVPEPTAVALMLAGLGLVGAAARRRRG